MVTTQQTNHQRNSVFISLTERQTCSEAHLYKRADAHFSSWCFWKSVPTNGVYVASTLWWLFTCENHQRHVHLTWCLPHPELSACYIRMNTADLLANWLYCKCVRKYWIFYSFPTHSTSDSRYMNFFSLVAVLHCTQEFTWLSGLSGAFRVKTQQTGLVSYIHLRVTEKEDRLFILGFCLWRQKNTCSTDILKKTVNMNSVFYLHLVDPIMCALLSMKNKTFSGSC